MKSLRQYFSEWQGLFLASAFCTSVLLLRILVTGRFRFSFLLWNLFLAFIPLVISEYLNSRPSPSKLMVILCTLVWLLFFPNAPYIITDLMHLTKDYIQIPWLASALIFSFAITALTAGIISLIQIKTVCSRNFSPLATNAFLLCIMPLTGFGIYLGRFERWNSWDLLTNPISLLSDCLHHLTNTKAIAVTFVFGGCLYVVLQLIQQVSRVNYDANKKIS